RLGSELDRAERLGGVDLLCAGHRELRFQLVDLAVEVRLLQDVCRVASRGRASFAARLGRNTDAREFDPAQLAARDLDLRADRPFTRRALAPDERFRDFVGEQRRRARLVRLRADRYELAFFGGLGFGFAACRRHVAGQAQAPLYFGDDDRVDQLSLVADICRGAPFGCAFARSRFFGARSQVYLR